MDMDDDSGRRSVFVVVKRLNVKAPYFCSILQFDSEEENNHDEPPASPETHLTDDEESAAPDQLDLKEYVAHFANPIQPASWLFSRLTNEELFMVPYFSDDIYANVPSLKGIAFNLRTKTLRTTNPPFSFKPLVVGCAVNLGVSIYFMPHPCDQCMSPDNRFQRYVPGWDNWQTLEPFPHPCNTIIQATAVWEDNILFNMLSCGREIWAFNVTENKWYPVTVKDEDKLCHRIVGEAVVVGNTIFALKDKPYNALLALTIQRDIAYTCSLLCEISVPEMSHISSMETRSLVHLGNNRFCIVQSCVPEWAPPDYQPIQLTYMTLQENSSMIVTGNCFRNLPIGDEGQFRVVFCFSLPEFKTPPTFQQAQKFFDINPYPKGFDREYYSDVQQSALGIPSAKHPPFEDQDYVSSQTNIIDEEDFGQGVSKTSDPADTLKRHLREVAANINLPLKESSISFIVSRYFRGCYGNFAPKAFSAVTRNPSHGYAQLSLPRAPKESAIGDGCPVSKRLKTVGEDIEHGGSRTRDPSADTSTPEIHMQEENSSASKRYPTVPEGGLIYQGRPLSSYTVTERIMIQRSWLEQFMASISLSRATRQVDVVYGDGVVQFNYNYYILVCF